MNDALYGLLMLGLLGLGILYCVLPFVLLSRLNDILWFLRADFDRKARADAATPPPVSWPSPLP